MKYKNCPFCGRLLRENEYLCPVCGADLSKEENNTVENTDGNTSGMGESAAVPYEVEHRFNWGAFGFTWIWLLVYKKYILALVIFVVGIIINMIFGYHPHPGTTPGLGDIIKVIIAVIINFSIDIWLGTQGNKWAWQNKRYESIENFHSVHKKWAIVVLVICLPLYLLGIIVIVAAMTIPTLMSQVNTASHEVAAKKATSQLYQAANLAVANEQPGSGYTTYAIANYFGQNLTGNKMGDVITTPDGMVYKFVSDGGCYNANCYAEVDTNGPENGPNELWTDKSEPKDIIQIPLRAANGYHINVYLPDVLNKNSQ